MIIYRENTKNFTKKKQLQLINKFSKVAGYKINIPKSVEFLYTNRNYRKRKLRKKNPIYKSIRKNKILWNKLRKDLYTENYEALMRDKADNK